MSKTLGILGAGHLGIQIAHLAISDNHFEKIVFFDDYSKAQKIADYEIIGSSNEVIPKFKEEKFDQLIIAIGYKHLKKREYFYTMFRESVPFATLIHSSNFIDPTAIIAEGCVLYPFSCIDQRVQIKPNTIVNLNCTIAHDTTIGSHCFLSPSVAIAGFCAIGDQNFIGINTTIIDSIETCKSVVTGGGSVVVKNIISSGIYVGNPAKKIKDDTI
jgi:sugar O-acyltransferase (sialic acid O-acetyltransferase NeuD family)